MSDDTSEQHAETPDREEAPAQPSRMSTQALVTHLTSRAGSGPTAIYAKALKAAHPFSSFTYDQWLAKAAAIGSTPVTVPQTTVVVPRAKRRVVAPVRSAGRLLPVRRVRAKV